MSDDFLCRLRLDGRQVVAGTNFTDKAEKLEVFQKRLRVDDYSAEYGRKQ